MSFSNINNISLWQNLYGLGVRKIGVTTLPPTGCLPATITLFGGGSNQCVGRLNQDAISFNNKLNTTSQVLQNNLPGLKLVVFDIYHPLLDMVIKPTDQGMTIFFRISNQHSLFLSIHTDMHINIHMDTNKVNWLKFHPQLSCRVLWSKEGLLWDGYNWDIPALQCQVYRNMLKCYAVRVLGWISSLWIS